MFARLVAFPLLCLAPLQEVRVRKETWPDGNPKVEVVVVTDELGAEIRQGRSRSFHENGQPASEGDFLQDKESGPWVFFHPNGARAAAGNFADGLRSGPWKTYFEDGKIESEGSYVRGARDGRWTFYREDGSKDRTASGMYELEVYRSKEEPRHYRGYLVDNLCQGTWTTFWPDKKKQFEGAFLDGKREGPWSFYHQDEAPSSLLLSGVYSGGEWSAPLPGLEPVPFDASAFPLPEPSPRGWPEDRALLEAALETMLAAGAVDEAAVQALAKEKARSIPIVLGEMIALDPESEPGRRALGLLEEEVLRPICAGRTLSFHGAAGPPDAPAARELVRAWLSLWALTRTDLVFWELQVPSPSAGGARGLLQNPPLLERDPKYNLSASTSAAPESSGQPGSAAAERPAYGTRFGKAKAELLRQAPRGTREAVANALSWLQAHQSEDGHWDSEDFAKHCGKIGPGTCEGPGIGHDVGLSALALLAFLGDGHTSHRGEHAPTVTKGLDWLAGRQVDGGLIGDRTEVAFLYDHAIATAAVCEAVALGAETLRAPAEKAVAVIHQARNPDAAWRYDLPANGENDTSVTGWMVAALVAARRAGLAVDAAALDGALAWIDQVTDATSGRVGYLSPGSFSSRTREDAAYPPENGEAMTAVGLFTRILLGQRPGTTPILKKHAELLAAIPPRWDPEFGCDMYYWYAGANALHQMGKPYWPGWEAALADVVIANQRKNGDRKGSWDPVGPWSSIGGRLCATALMTLTLECPYRSARLLEEKD